MVLPAATFGHQWAGKVIKFVVDKMAVAGPHIVSTCTDASLSLSCI